MKAEQGFSVQLRGQTSVPALSLLAVLHLFKPTFTAGAGGAGRSARLHASTSPRPQPQAEQISISAESSGFFVDPLSASINILRTGRTGPRWLFVYSSTIKRGGQAASPGAESVSLCLSHLPTDKRRNPQLPLQRVAVAHCRGEAGNPRVTNGFSFLLVAVWISRTFGSSPFLSVDLYLLLFKSCQGHKCVCVCVGSRHLFNSIMVLEWNRRSSGLVA